LKPAPECAQFLKNQNLNLQTFFGNMLKNGVLAAQIHEAPF
jgi:hypothetical protein